ncbi:MAG: hypothetical protein R2862_00810 [Thermoanaerobaculia bacterium]
MAARLRAGRRTTRPSTSLDLAPTILARFGVAADDLPGADLAVPAKSGPWFQLSQDAVRLGSLKLLRGNAERRGRSTIWRLIRGSGRILLGARA